MSLTDEKQKKVLSLLKELQRLTQDDYNIIKLGELCIKCGLNSNLTIPFLKYRTWIQEKSMGKRRAYKWNSKIQANDDLVKTYEREILEFKNKPKKSVEKTPQDLNLKPLATVMEGPLNYIRLDKKLTELVLAKKLDKDAYFELKEYIAELTGQK